MFLRLPLGLIFSALLIQCLAVPYMKWVAEWKLYSFGNALTSLSPTTANQLGVGIWIPAAGVLLALGLGFSLATLVLILLDLAHAASKRQIYRRIHGSKA